MYDRVLTPEHGSFTSPAFFCEPSTCFMKRLRQVASRKKEPGAYEKVSSKMLDTLLEIFRYAHYCHNPTVSSHDPTVSSHDLTVSSHDPTVSSHDPTVSSHDLTVSSHDPTVSSHDLTMSSHDPTVSSHGLTVSYREHLRCPHTLPLHEIFYFDNASSLRKVNSHI